MNQGVLALFVRSLREENRRPTTYLLRFLLIALVLLVVAANHQAFRYGGGAPGLRVFSLVTILNLVFISVVGLSYFASAITEEKEDGTLALLRMTNLNSLSILLGKSTSRLIGFLLHLMTQIPFVTLAVTLGGVSLRQVFTVYAILAAFTFLLANLALLFSVIFRRTSLAVTCTLSVLILSFGGTWVLSFFFNIWFGTDFGLGLVSRWMWMANPIGSLMGAFAVGLTELPMVQLLSNVIAGACFFGLSWLVFDTFNQGEGRGATPSAARKPRPSQAPSTPTAIAETPPSNKPRPGRFAVTWREFYFECGGTQRLWLTFVILLFLSAFLLFLRYSVSQSPIRPQEIGGVLIVLGLLCAGVRWALEMGSVFQHERKHQTWSALSLLPLSIRQLAYQKLLASFISTLPALLLAASGYVMLADELSWNEETLFSLLMIASWILFGSHLTVYFSLYLRWGALPLTLVSCVLLQVVMGLVSVMMGLHRTGGMLFLWCLGLGLGALILHHLIGSRLAELAAED